MAGSFSVGGWREGRCREVWKNRVHKNHCEGCNLWFLQGFLGIGKFANIAKVAKVAKVYICGNGCRSELGAAYAEGGAGRWMSWAELASRYLDFYDMWM